MLISSLKYVLRNVWPNIWSPWPSQVDIINYTNLYLWMRKKANPWRHHDLVTELAEPNLKFNPVSKQVSSFTLHLLNKKQTLFFFFSFFSQPFLEPRSPISRAYSNSKIILKEPSIIMIKFPEYPKIFNQHTPEMHTQSQQALSMSLVQPLTAIFLHNPSVMSAVTRVEYWPDFFCKIWNSFLNTQIGPIPACPEQINSILAKACVKPLGWSIWNCWYFNLRNSIFTWFKGKKWAHLFLVRPHLPRCPILQGERTSTHSVDRNERCCY